jgi:hypothetical protein
MLRGPAVPGFTWITPEAALVKSPVIANCELYAPSADSMRIVPALVAPLAVVEHFRAVSNELASPKVLSCTSSGEPKASNWALTGTGSFQTANASYFIGLDADETKPQTLLSGDKNVTKSGTVAAAGTTVSYTAPAGGGDNTDASWDQSTHVRQGNVCLGDGSVQQLTESGLRKQITSAVQTGITNVNLQFP